MKIKIFKRSYLARTLLVILFFVGLLVLSEISYALNSGKLNNIFVFYHLLLFETNTQKNNCNKSLQHLFRLTDKVIKYRYNINSEQSPKNYSVFTYLDVPDSCSKLFIDYKSTEVSHIYKMDILDANLSYIYYLSALKADKLGLSDMVPKLLQTAIYLNPDFSFYYIELSNYFSSIGEELKAIDQIRICMSFNYPKKHCEDYSNGLINLTENNSLGFQKEFIDSYFKKEIYVSK